MVRKNIPFGFLLDYLVPVEVTIKPMFGFFVIYIKERMVMAVRQGKDHPEANGVWVATRPEHLQSLKKVLPSLRAVSFFSKDNKETAWQVISPDTADFEQEVRKACELIVKGDQRIGRIPGGEKNQPG